MLGISADTRSAITKDDSHMGVTCEMGVGGGLLLLHAILLILIQIQAEHLVGELEGPLDFALIFRLDLNGLVDGRGVVVRTAVHLVLDALVTGQQRDSKLALDHARGRFCTRRTCVCR